MTDRIKNVIIPIELMVIVITFFAIMLIKSPADYSDSERRVLAGKPALNAESIMSGKYMSSFEDYCLDQFPLRDSFRAIKAAFSKYTLAKRDNNDICVINGYISKLEYPLNYPMLDHAIDRFNYINDTYLIKNGIKPYMVIVPDKNYYLTNGKNYLRIDYDALYDYVYDNTDYMEHIDIRNDLSINDYYYTDTHWKQTEIIDIADKILGTMNDRSVITDNHYETREIEEPFYGVYYGQAALNITPDRLEYLTSKSIDKCTVINYDTGKARETKVYNMEKAHGRDPYEMFLDGSTAIITIENDGAATDKQLIMFRDSFGSSLAPLFIETYSRITLVDIRYVQSSMLSAFIDFDNADVLFEYSTLLLNNSLGLK